MFSQHNEEAIIAGAFQGRSGRFLDVGAYDGVTFSNTRALALAGWAGVCVEASPHAFAALIRNCRDRPNVQCVQAAMTPHQDGEIRLWETPDALSTTCEANRAQWEGYAHFVPVVVRSISVNTFLSAHPGPYDLVSIDTEGTSVDLALAFPWDRLATRCLCVEHDSELERLTSGLRGHGFGVIARTEYNLIFAREGSL